MARDFVNLAARLLTHAVLASAVVIAGQSCSSDSLRPSLTVLATNAADAANAKCAREFDRTPFSASSYPIRQTDGGFEWGHLDPLATDSDGYSAKVVLGADGTVLTAECYLSKSIGFVE